METREQDDSFVQNYLLRFANGYQRAQELAKFAPRLGKSERLFLQGYGSGLSFAEAAFKENGRVEDAIEVGLTKIVSGGLAQRDADCRAGFNAAHRYLLLGEESECLDQIEKSVDVLARENTPPPGMPVHK